MILIWENGEEYSAGGIIFYNCADWPLEDVEMLGEILCLRNENAKILAIAPDFEWREKRNMCPGEKALDAYWIKGIKLKEKYIGALRKNEDHIRKSALEEIKEYQEEINDSQNEIEMAKISMSEIDEYAIEYNEEEINRAQKNIKEIKQTLINLDKILIMNCQK